MARQRGKKAKEGEGGILFIDYYKSNGDNNCR
jgi:hypothetical protein